MAIERRDNDKQVEELRAEADQIESKVNFMLLVTVLENDTSIIDGRTPQEERG
jgi:hypothetical protein